MVKKMIICALLCMILCSIVGCTESQLFTDDVSTVPSTQSAVGETTDSLVSNQSNVPTNSGDDNMNAICKLIVNGKDITAAANIKLNYEYRYAELPIVAIMKEVGAKVEWQSKTEAKIIFDGKEYFLDTAKGSLIEAGSSFNILAVAPGSKHGIFYQAADNELVVDSDSAQLLLINIMGLKINIDYDDRIVNIGR